MAALFLDLLLNLFLLLKEEIQELGRILGHIEEIKHLMAPSFSILHVERFFFSMPTWTNLHF